MTLNFIHSFCLSFLWRYSFRVHESQSHYYQVEMEVQFQSSSVDTWFGKTSCYSSDGVRVLAPPVVSTGFPGGASGEEPTCQSKRPKRHRFDPWVGKILWTRGHDNPLQYPCLENPMDRGAWKATVHGVARSQRQLKRLSTPARVLHDYRCVGGLVIAGQWWESWLFADVPWVIPGGEEVPWLPRAGGSPGSPPSPMTRQRCGEGLVTRQRGWKFEPPVWPSLILQASCGVSCFSFTRMDTSASCSVCAGEGRNGLQSFPVVLGWSRVVINWQLSPARLSLSWNFG